MPRLPLTLGSYGEISVWSEGSGFIARTKFRDLDGVLRLVKRSGPSKAAADLWLVELEAMVDAGQRSPGTLTTYTFVYGGHVKPALDALRLREVTTPLWTGLFRQSKPSRLRGHERPR